MAQQNQNTPKKVTVRTPSPAYQEMEPRWELIDTLLGGTEAMRAAGQKYTPQYPAEETKSYQTRLARSVLLNRTESTLETLAGKPFSQKITLGEDVPTSIAELAENIDRRGSSLHVFCKNWFRDAWRAGFSFVLVDFTAPPVMYDDQGNEITGPRTLADDRRDNLRPFWQHIKPEHVLALYTEIDDQGNEHVSHLRILEITVERRGWEEVVVERVRVLEPGRWQVWAPVDPKKQDSDWVLESEGTTSLGFVSLITFFAGVRTGPASCKPPLTDLAWLNVAHWQSSSDQRNVLTVSRFPILAGSGVSGADNVRIGPNQYLSTEQADGKWYYVEHSGAAIEAGAKDLESLEAQMAEYGAEFLRKKPGGTTATERALDSAEGSSYLEATAQDFKDCVELALQYTAEWLGEAQGGSVTLAEIDPLDSNDATDLDALLKMRANRDISRLTLVNAMKNRKVLPDDFDPEVDQEALDDEGADGLNDMFNKGNGTQNNPPIIPADDANPSGKPPTGPAPQDKTE